MPTFAEYQGLHVGGLVTPLTASTTNSLLEDADPALAAVLAFYQAMLVTHLGARWDAEVTKAGLTSLVGAIAPLAIPYDPAPMLTGVQLAPPLIAVFPTTERYDERTRNWWEVLGTHTAEWVLPPLTPGQYLALYPFLRAAAKVLVDRTERGFDPSYLSGAQVFLPAGIAEIRVVEAHYGSIFGQTSNILFPTVALTLEIKEQSSTVAGLPAFAGVDAIVQTTDPGGANAIDVVAAEQNF